jgi:hypothetical protein
MLNYPFNLKFFIDFISYNYINTLLYYNLIIKLNFNRFLRFFKI